MSTTRSVFPFLFSVIISLLAGSSLLAINESDWTLEDVLTKVEEANGGLEAIEEVSNLRVRGEVMTDSMTYDFLLLKKRPNKVRIHLMFQGRSLENGFDGQTAWRRVWVGSTDKVERLSSVDLARTNLDVDFDGPLIGEPMPGTTRRFAGVERIDRVDYFLVVVEAEHVRTTHYIDSRNFREWKTVREILENGEVTSSIISTFSDYERHKTIWLAHKIVRELSDGTTETVIVQDAEIDPGILDRAFQVPRQWSGSN